jgi:hypothetical protein
MPLEFDNQRIDITGKGQLNFAKAMAFFFVRERDMVLSCAVSPTNGLVLFWCIPDNVVRTEWNKNTPVPAIGAGVIAKLPYPMDREAATQFAWFWLQSSEAGQCLGLEPDIDGDSTVGWRVYNEEWCAVAGWSQALVAIQPIWAMCGK